MREAMGAALVQRLPEALPKTLKEVVSDPDFWASAKSGIREHVKREAGGWITRVVWQSISRVMLFLVLGSIVYAIGGWSAVVGLFGKSEGLK